MVLRRDVVLLLAAVNSVAQAFLVGLPRHAGPATACPGLWGPEKRMTALAAGLQRAACPAARRPVQADGIGRCGGDGCRRAGRDARAGALQMQQAGNGADRGISRRQVVSIAAASLAGCVLGGPRAGGAETIAAPAWRPAYGDNGKPQWLGFTEAEATYELRFIEYLARFLLNFDESSRELFKSQAEPLSVLPLERRQQARFEQFARFCTSVEYGLRPYNGTNGAAKLTRVLVARYGRNNTDALQQIGFLFTLMQNSTQPVQEIARILGRLENASVDSILVKDGGSGYTGKVPLATIKDSYGPRARANASVSVRETGKLLTVRIKNGGAGYLTPPKVQFPGLGSNETAFASMIDNQVLGVKFRAPVAEAVVRDGKVVDVKLKDRGEGLSSFASNSKGLSALRVEFQPQDGQVPVVLAEGYAVIDRVVDAIQVKSSGAGYTAELPPSVVVEGPGETNGDKDLGRQATATVRLKAQPKPAPPPTLMYVGPEIDDEDITVFTKLFPRTVRRVPALATDCVCCVFRRAFVACYDLCRM